MDVSTTTGRDVTVAETVWRSSPLAFFRLDHGVITAANPAAGALIGVAEPQLRGRSADDLLPPRDRGHDLFGPATLAEQMPLSCYVRNRNGEEIPTLVWLTPTSTDTERLTAVIAEVSTAPHLEAAVEATTATNGSHLSEEIEMVVQHLYAAGLALSAHRSAITSDAATDQLDRAVDVLDRLLTELTTSRTNGSQTRAE